MSIRFVLGLMIGLVIGASIAVVLSGGAKTPAGAGDE
jgi:hypothetical protein